MKQTKNIIGTHLTSYSEIMCVMQWLQCIILHCDSDSDIYILVSHLHDKKPYISRVFYAKYVMVYMANAIGTNLELT